MENILHKKINKFIYCFMYKIHTTRTVYKLKEIENKAHVNNTRIA